MVTTQDARHYILITWDNVISLVTTNGLMFVTAVFGRWVYIRNKQTPDQ